MKDYEDIINLPHHISKRYPQMPVEDRAAQFAPFAALTGYDAAIKETARLTDARLELAEDAIAEIDAKLRYIKDKLPNTDEITIVYFKADMIKSGGEYVTITGTVKNIDLYNHRVLMHDGTMINMKDIYSIN